MKKRIFCFSCVLIFMLSFGGYAQQQPDFPSKYHKRIDTTAIREYISKLPYDELIPLYQKFVQQPFEQKTVKPALLYPHACQIVKRLEAYVANRPATYMEMGQADWNARFNRDFSHQILVTHVQLLDQLYKDEEAFRYTVFAEKYLDFNYAAVNSVYALLLDKYGRHDKMNEVLLESIYRNQATPEMIGLLAREYQKENRPEAGFSDYLHSLKNKKSN